MKEAKFVAFSTQKGGAGKTTLTVLMASYLHYVKGLNVAVVDCDFPQFSASDMRNRDMENIKENKMLANQCSELYKRIGKRSYPIIESRPETAIETAGEMMKQQDIDIIFFDLPGTMNNKGTMRTIAHMDYVFCPITADRVVMQSSLTFAKVINDKLVTTGKTNIKGMYFVWNMVDAREKTRLYEVYDRIISEQPLRRRYLTASDSAGRVTRRTSARCSAQRCFLLIGLSSRAAASRNLQTRCWAL